VYNDWDDTYDVKSEYKWDSDAKSEDIMCESCCEIYHKDELEALPDFNNAMVCYDCYDSMMYEMYGDEYLSDRDEEVIQYNKSFEQPKSAYDPLAWK
jgi:hypothetical protein